LIFCQPISGRDNCPQPYSVKQTTNIIVCRVIRLKLRSEFWRIGMWWKNLSTICRINMGVNREKSKIYWCSFCLMKAVWNLSQAVLCCHGNVCLERFTS